MKTTALAAIFTLFLISIVTPSLTSAQTSGSAASGSYRFALDDGLAKTLEFDARLDERGATTGHMTFRDAAGIVESDPDGEPLREESPAEFFIAADLDSLTIEHNRAVMGGTVRDSSNPGYVGRWVQLVIEDNGEGGLDKLSWCFCKPETSGWVPADAEDPRDEGAFWHWWATDSERRDDAGVQSTNIIPGNRRSCPVAPLSSYEFPETRGEGDILIR
ncbi:MAG TPA: hypothetical protein VGN90_01685 [Pyrinomonadaceae bacterium]|jgi:hypothetical protein|nr:hypothetical protein [Pyrinomonadaceae bacterium]